MFRFEKLFSFLLDIKLGSRGFKVEFCYLQDNIYKLFVINFIIVFIGSINEIIRAEMIKNNKVLQKCKV